MLALAPAIVKTSSFGSSAGKGRSGLVDARDVAAVAAEIAAAPPGSAGKTYWSHRPGLVSNYDVAAVLIELLGRHHHLPGADLRGEQGRDDPRQRPGGRSRR